VLAGAVCAFIISKSGAGGWHSSPGIGAGDSEGFC
jgi:hypothetical protein